MIQMGAMMGIKTYSELMTIRTFEERFTYLVLYKSIGVATFGFDRYLNQEFYNSWLWRSVRNKIIIRDHACDLAIPGREIFDAIRIHHMNPMTIEDIERGNPAILNPEFLICTSIGTHNAIHFGNSTTLSHLPSERRKGDTKLW